ncbi:transposase [Streptomyces zhihengii]
MLAELTSEVFASLPRSDQRRKGIQYLNGLLSIRGRKSIRNIANLLGDDVSEQNLHHFICDSTWDWMPIRRALAEAVETALPTRAWVVAPMTIPKAGRNSVGVERHYSPALGQTLNAQRAIGVWAASESASVPVNWRLQLSSSWLRDAPRRSQAAIPEGASAEGLAECAVEAARQTAAGWGLRARPTVLDLGEAPEPLLELTAAGHLPLLVRVGPDTPLVATDLAPAGREQTTLTAHRIMGLARTLRRPVPGAPPTPGAGRTPPRGPRTRGPAPAPGAGQAPGPTAPGAPRHGHVRRPVAGRAVALQPHRTPAGAPDPPETAHPPGGRGLRRRRGAGGHPGLHGALLPGLAPARHPRLRRPRRRRPGRPDPAAPRAAG